MSPVFNIDLTKADVVPEGDYVATIKSVTAKESKAGDSTNFNWMLALPSLNGRTLFHLTNSKIPSRIKEMMDAAKVAYTEVGFDPDQAVGAQINIKVGMKDDPVYGLQNTVIKAWAV